MHLAFLHASRAAVDPVAEYYSTQEPGWQFTHLLDDGVMRLLRAKSWPAARARLARHVTDLREVYGADEVLLTCSAVPREDVEALGVEKIDIPMARMAAETGDRIGVLATFPSTQQVTRELILHFRPDAQLTEHLEAAALEQLLAGNTAAHDELFLAALENFRGRVDCLVLAQVSMARLAEETRRRLGMPVYESLSTSLAALRAKLPPAGNVAAS
jgi:hypothetical protein